MAKPVPYLPRSWRLKKEPLAIEGLPLKYFLLLLALLCSALALVASPRSALTAGVVWTVMYCPQRLHQYWTHRRCRAYLILHETTPVVRLRREGEAWKLAENVTEKPWREPLFMVTSTTQTYPAEELCSVLTSCGIDPLTSTLAAESVRDLVA